MDQAIPHPSYVEVPRPNSSMITNEFLVADLTIVEDSIISNIKVERPFNWESSAPTRARIASTTAISALSQGTKLPMWAINTHTPTLLMYVLLPHMFGPVMICSVFPSLSKFTSLGIKSRCSWCSRQG